MNDLTLTADILAAIEKHGGWRNVLNRLESLAPAGLSAEEAEYLRQLEMHIQGDAIGSMVVMDQAMARGLASTIRRLSGPAANPSQGVDDAYQPHGRERDHYRLLYGFILDCNVIGPEEAGRNLARSIKESTAALAHKAGGE